MKMPNSNINAHLNNSLVPSFIKPIMVVAMIGALTLSSFGQYLEYAKGIGGVNHDAGLSIATDASGNTYITGIFRDTADFDPEGGTQNLISKGNADIFFAKFDVNGNYLWAKAIGGTEYDESVGIVIDDTGNVYIAGNFQDTADFDPNTGTQDLSSFGMSDIFFAKYDSNGNYIWVKTIGGQYIDNCQGLAIDEFGYVHITGTFESIVDFDPGADTILLIPTSFSNNMYFAKYDANGNYVWAKGIWEEFSGVGGNSIAIDDTGNVFVTGNFNGTIDFDPDSGTQNLTSDNSGDVFFVKYDSDGKYVWANVIGDNSGLEVSYSIITDTSGNIYVTGWFDGMTDFDPGVGTQNLTSTDGGVDLFFAKYDDNGNYAWAKAIGGSEPDEAKSIAIDDSGNVYVTGYFRDTVDFDPDTGTHILVSAGLQDIFFSKYDPNGNFLWAKAIGGQTNEKGYSIATDDKGNVFITGAFSDTVDFDLGTCTQKLASKGKNDIFFAKYSQIQSSDLNIITSKTDIICNGSNDGAATVSVTCGTSPFSYVWSNGSTSSSINNLSTGNYIVTVSDADTNQIITSFSIINLYPTYSTLINTNICSNDSILLGDSYQNTSGVYYDTLASVNSCDSVIITTLTVNSTYLTPVTITICSNDSIFIGDSYQDTSGVYYDTLSSVNSCDSVIITTLTVNSTYFAPVTATICSNDSILLGGSYQNTSGIYFDTLSSGNSCDTVIITTLTVNPIYSTSVTATICSNDSILLGGNYQNTSGVYYDTLSSGNSCDSVIITTLAVNLIPETPIITGSNGILTSSSGTGNQWYLNGSIITGASSQNFTPTENGSYTIKVTDGNNCFSVSSSFEVTFVGIIENAMIKGLRIYPNPTTGEFTVEMDVLEIQDLQITITNVLGQKIYFDKVGKSMGTYKKKFDFNKYSKGIYHLQIKSEKGEINRQVIYQ